MSLGNKHLSNRRKNLGKKKEGFLRNRNAFVPSKSVGPSLKKGKSVRPSLRKSKSVRPSLRKSKSVLKLNAMRQSDMRKRGRSASRLKRAVKNRRVEFVRRKKDERSIKKGCHLSDHLMVTSQYLLM